MSCPEELELFLLHEGEELEEDRAKEIGEHLATCTDCQATLAELKMLGAAFTPPESFTQRDEDAFILDLVREIDRTETGERDHGSDPTDEDKELLKTIRPTKLWTPRFKLAAARAMFTLPSSRGCRSTSRTLRRNSGSSSRKRTP